MSEQYGGCLYLEDGTRIQLVRCQECMWGQCPGGPHDWADQDDIDHALKTGQPSPVGQPCQCVCKDRPLEEPEEPPFGVDDYEQDHHPCPICGSENACSYDVEGRPMIHTFGEDDE